MVSTAPRRADLRVVRIIKCLRMLQGACYSVDDLAAQLSVSRRTVYRDLRLLGAAGVPVVRRMADRGLHVPPAPLL